MIWCIGNLLNDLTKRVFESSTNDRCRVRYNLALQHNRRKYKNLFCTFSYFSCIFTKLFCGNRSSVIWFMSNRKVIMCLSYVLQMLKHPICKQVMHLGTFFKSVIPFLCSALHCCLNKIFAVICLISAIILLRWCLLLL